MQKMRFIPQEELARRTGEWLRGKREETGMSQTDFVYWLRAQKRWKISQGQWSNWELGRHAPDRRSLHQLIRIFPDFPQELLTGIEDKGREMRSLVSSAA